MDVEEQYDKIYRYCYFKLYDKQLAQDNIDEEAVCDKSEEWINNLILRTAIAKLPKKEQELLFLRYVNEISVASICKITGISRFAVYRRLSKSLKWLKEELKKEGFSE